MVAIVLISLAGTMISNASFNLALQAMVRKKNLGEANNQSFEICPEPEYFQEDNPPNVTEPVIINSSRLRDKLYDWSQTTQSLLFGSFFVASVILKPMAGVLVQKFGGKWFLTGCLFISCFLSSVLPFTADYIYLLVAIRLLMGANAAIVYPSAYTIIINWVPLKRRSFCFSLFGVSISTAIIVGFLSTGVIFKTYGWPGLFFMPGIVSGIIGIITLIFLKNEPKTVDSNKELVNVKKMPKNDSQEKIVDEDEEDSDNQEEIKHEDNKENKTRNLSTPFLSILRNKAFLAYIFFQFNQGFTTTIQASKLPVYFTKVLHEDLGRFGNWAAILCVVAVVSALMSGYMADKLVNKKYLSRTNTRKLCVVIAGIGPSVCLMCIPAAGCSTKVVYIIICVLVFGEGFGTSLISLPSEMTENFSSVTYSMAAMMGALAGFVAPSFAGLILDYVKNQWTAWCILYSASGSLMILGTVSFVYFGSAERQDFDFVDDSCTTNKDSRQSPEC